MNQIDFLATQPHYIDHIAPIWDALAEDNIGSFYVPHELIGHAQRKLEHHLYLFSYEDNSPETYGISPILVCGYGDMKYVQRVSPERPIFMMEHGTGHTFGKSAYPNGPGARDGVSLFLPPNQYTADKIRAVRNTPYKVIGTPKLDWVTNYTFNLHSPPTVCISFHHGHKRKQPPECGSAFEHYCDIVPELKKQFNLIAHGHPLDRERDRKFFNSMGVPFVEDFQDVMKMADVYVNDLSSTLYEFLSTGKPVVILNAPWFRKNVQHGLRFWDYSDIGIQVEQPDQLRKAIENTLDFPEDFAPQRGKAIRELFPYLGHSARRAATVIHEALAEEENVL